jgi:hypothetical protein
VTIEFTDAAIATLRLNPAKYAGTNTTILYWQGPIQDRGYAGNFTTLAHYTSEIHSLHTPLTTGQQIHTPAILTSTFGAGRVLLSSPHP